MPTRQDRIRKLELTVVEQRRDYDLLEKLFQQAKTKNITFLAAALALLGYLYNNPQESGLKNKLFIPNEPYGVIVYAIGLFLFLFALTLLLIALKPFSWSTAYDPKTDNLAPSDYEEYLKYTKGRYDKISDTNCKSYSTKQTLLNISFIPLLTGTIILLLLKTFGG